MLSTRLTQRTNEQKFKINWRRGVFVGKEMKGPMAKSEKSSGKYNRDIRNSKHGRQKGLGWVNNRTANREKPEPTQTEKVW